MSPSVTTHGRSSAGHTVLGAAAILALVLFGAITAACSNAEAVDVSSDTIIIDVRSAEEYAAGHLEGARLLDLNSGEFAASLPDLDPTASYVVYCRSGNRSGQATSMMIDAGFTDVTDLGSMQNASGSTGIPVVRTNG